MLDSEVAPITRSPGVGRLMWVSGRTLDDEIQLRHVKKHFRHTSGSRSLRDHATMYES
jgi:hypothetical protein